MPSSINFWHPDPRRRFRSVVEGDLRTAAELDLAVAFMTKAGVDFLLDRLERGLSPDHCRVSVSVHFPTDLAALCRLSDRLADRLHIHLGGEAPREKSGKSCPLMHSKVIWAGKEDGKVTIFVGSHNWTSTALDGANMEASVRIECRPDESFAQDVKAHLDACFNACVPFDQDDVDFYRSLQVYLHPNLHAAESEELGDFHPVPAAPAVVIHAEDERTDESPDLMLYIPKRDEPPDDWLSANLRTRVYLYLYPPGTLLGRRTPGADPVLYEGEVRTFTDIKNPINGQPATCQIDDLNTPVLKTLSPSVIPAAGQGVRAQIVVSLERRGEGGLPVYVVGETRPGVRVKPVFQEQAEPLLDRVGDEPPLPENILRYYESYPARHGHFIFQVPEPSRTTTKLKVPGEAFYRVAPKQTLSESLQQREIVPVIKSARSKLSTRYVYQVYFVFKPRPGTHQA